VKWLADTNILLRSVHAAHPMYGDVSRAVDILFDRGDDIHIFGQNLIEFWTVATRTITENGLGFTITGAAVELTKLKTTFTLLPDTADILPLWEELVVRYEVRGKQSHDARLVAAMNAHNLTHLLTFDQSDFKRFSEITVVNRINVS
jgi:predicted nucleic acid-binding protein